MKIRLKRLLHFYNPLTLSIELIVDLIDYSQKETFRLRPLIVFLYYNFRKKARCFAGDVGSISMAFVVVYFLLDFTFKTDQYWLIFLIGFYGVDSILTIVERLIRGENIFKPHRRHYYQLLANEWKLDHRIVSSLYFLFNTIILVLVALFPIKIVEKFL